MNINFKKALPLILIIMLILTIIRINLESISRILKKEISSMEISDPDAGHGVITLNDIKGFPLPVQKYLKYAGVIGKKRVNNVQMAFEGEFRMSPKQPWMKIKTAQFNDINNVTRIFIIKARMFGFITMVGKDIYRDGKGNMKGKLMHYIPLFDEKGEEFDIGELVTFLNDIFLLCPSGLINLKARLKWKSLSGNRVQVAFTDNKITVKAELHFNDKGELINFYTTDRFLKLPEDGSEGEYKRTKWSTPLYEYKEVNGLLLPGGGDAIWHTENGEFHYAKFKLKKLDYNIKK